LEEEQRMMVEDELLKNGMPPLLPPIPDATTASVELPVSIKT